MEKEIKKDSDTLLSTEELRTIFNIIVKQQKELEQEKTKSNNYKELIIKALAINNKVLNAKEKPENYEEILDLNIEILRVREIAEDVLGRS